MGKRENSGTCALFWICSIRLELVGPAAGKRLAPDNQAIPQPRGSWPVCQSARTASSISHQFRPANSFLAQQAAIDSFPHCLAIVLVSLLTERSHNEDSKRKGFMKIMVSSWAAVALLAMCGCSSTQVSHMEGRGTKAVYNAPFDATWRAAVDAAQQGDLTVLNADPSTGYISAKRGIHVESFGENVGIWVSRLAPTQTSVEVVSRQA